MSETTIEEKAGLVIQDLGIETDERGRPRMSAAQADKFVKAASARSVLVGWLRDDESSRIEAGPLAFVAQLQVAPSLWCARIEANGQVIERIGDLYESREAAEGACRTRGRSLSDEILMAVDEMTCTPDGGSGS